jgi:hypothetical protein
MFCECRTIPNCSKKKKHGFRVINPSFRLELKPDRIGFLPHLSHRTTNYDLSNIV